MTAIYIWQQEDWPRFRWDDARLSYQLGRVRSLQGKLVGKMSALGFDLKNSAMLDTEKSIGRILQKAAFWDKHRSVSMNERQTKLVNLLWDGFDGKLTSSKWAKITKCSADTALRDIQDLIAKHVLRKTDEGGRSTNYELDV